MVSKHPLNPDVEMFRWGPIPGRFFCLAEFTEAIFQKIIDTYGIGWPKTLFLHAHGRMVWLNEMPELIEVGQEIFKAQMIDVTAREATKRNWDLALAKVKEIEQEIDRGVQSLRDQELAILWKKFYEALSHFWVPTIPWELGNYGSVTMLEQALKSYIGDTAEMHSALEILTAPESLSFYQEEEIDLAETTDLEDHQHQYFWLRNSYGGVEILPTSFFADRKGEMHTNLRQELIDHIDHTKRRKTELCTKLNLSAEVKAIAEAVCRGVEWQDERKKHIFISLHYKHLLLEEVSRRSGLTLEDLFNWAPSEILAYLETGAILADHAERLGGFGVYAVASTYEMFGSEAMRGFWQAYAEEKAADDVQEVKGIIACPGKEGVVQGCVRILLDPKEMGDLEDGEVLVAPMTSPEYVFAMKKSLAIVTDTGGLMSHAAIVSRELQKPCIVGTKLATKIFKDGDLVEIDPVAGTVRKIN